MSPNFAARRTKYNECKDASETEFRFCDAVILDDTVIGRRKRFGMTTMPALFIGHSRGGGEGPARAALIENWQR